MGDLTFEKLCFNWSVFFLNDKLALICYVPKSKSPNNMGVVAPDIGSISPWVRSPPSRIDPKQRRQGRQLSCKLFTSNLPRLEVRASVTTYLICTYHIHLTFVRLEYKNKPSGASL